VKQKNEIKAKIQRKEPFTQVMFRFPDPNAAELIAKSGVDMLIIDNEHYPFDDSTILAILRACQIHDVACGIRVINSEPSRISHMMDMGMDVILVPHIDSYEQALTIVNAVKFAPVGTRGFCPIVRAANYGIGVSYKEFLTSSNENTMVFLMVESKAGLEDLDRILSIPEIDGIAVGPSDVSASYGYPGQIDHPVVKEALNKGFEKILASDKVLCGLAYTPDAMRTAIAKGVGCLVIGSDLQNTSNGFRDLVSAFKKMDTSKGGSYASRK